MRLRVKHQWFAMAAEIETLRTRKQTLKEELQIEGQREKNLLEDIDVLKEKIEIYGIEKQLDAKREMVRDLESKKSELQNQLNQTTPVTKKEEEPKESTPEPSVIVLPDLNSETVESQEVQEQEPQESEAQRRRRWF